MTLARILICAGSDSGGGAGIQADIKTVTALGGYATTAITALTAQNTTGVYGVMPVEPGFIRQQMRAVLSDLGADAVKTGMLGDAAAIAAIAETLAELAPGLPLVVDPVLIAKGGANLLASDAIGALKTLLIPRATLLTPNLPEAEALLGHPIPDVAAMQAAGAELRGLGARAVLVKGGHLPGDRLYDVLVGPDGVEIFEGVRIDTRHTHGTGCTLASAIATGLGQGLAPSAAVARARAYLIEAIRTAPGFGRGHGPLNHGHTVRRAEGAAGSGRRITERRDRSGKMNADIAKLRQNMFGMIGPYPDDCEGFHGRRTMTGTAFFPAGDGLWKGDGNTDPTLPVGGVLFLGSDWGDADSYDESGEGEADGRTWQGLLEIVRLAKIPLGQIFCTNAWPCMRTGAHAVGGVVPASKDRDFALRCKAFFLHTLDLMRPKLVVPLGVLPTSFISSLTSAEPSPWGKASSWREIDATPVWRRRDFNVVPIVHPSMPNRRHRKNANTIEAEAALISSALDR